MELTRVVLLSALFLIIFMLWQAWQNDYDKVKVTTPQAAAQQAFQPATTSTVSTTSVATQQPMTKTAAVPEQIVTVSTDVLNVSIDTLGGNIIQTYLLKYPKDLNKPQPFQMFSNDPATLYVAQSGLVGNNGPDTMQGQGVYSSPETSYTLNPGQDQVVVNLKWKNSAGLNVTKQFIFKRGQYDVTVNYIVDNKTSTAWNGQFYAQLQRKKVPPPQHGLFAINPYIGGAISSSEHPYEKISYNKMDEENVNQSITGGWAAMLEHYFVSAWIPDNSQTFNYYSHVTDNDIYTLGFIGQPISVAPNTTYQTSAHLYVGPALMDNLKQAAPNLDLTIDYGILWFISIAIFWLLKHVYQFVGNWGWSIVIVTCLIKLAFYHLSAKSFRSMAAMKKLQPRLQALRERYGDDRQKLTQATMELYKQEKISPVSGCLPMLVQIPVFIALYWVLLESVELRQAPFILWIHDLSTKDPYMILPIIMGLTMFVQQKLNPPSADPVQAKMMHFLPVLFTILFINFPAGLVLYWIVNSALQVLQQWYVMRSMDVAEAKKKA